MDQSSPTAHSPAPMEESPAQKQARLRRERREAKILAGGSARLNQITSLSGRPAEPAEPSPNSPFHPTAAASSATARGAPHGSDDPEEVDISQHFYTPGGADTPGNGVGRQFQRQLQQMMMMGNGSPGSISNNAEDNPFATADSSFLQDQQRHQRQQPQQQGQVGVGMGTGLGTGMGNGMGDGGEDPLSRILQQMMAGGGGPGGGGGTDGLPPGLAAMFGGAGAQVQQAPSQTDKYGYMWKIVHAVFALALGIYITSATSFSGSRLARTTSGFVDSSGAVDVGVQFFWVFATAELVLQSSRFFVERGRVSRSGLLGTVAGFLPEPYQGYLGLVGRYSGIWNTVVQDATVVIFMLGCVAWWKESAR